MGSFISIMMVKRKLFLYLNILTVDGNIEIHNLENTLNPIDCNPIAETLHLIPTRK